MKKLIIALILISQISLIEASAINPDSSYCFWHDLSIEFWENQNRKYFEYNNYGLKTSEIKQNWNAAINNWENDVQYNIGYNDDNLLIEYVTLYWEDEWINDWRETSVYNSNSQVIEWTYQNWNTQYEEWTGGEQYSYDFDVSGNEINKIYREWNSNTNSFSDLSKWISTYTENTISLRVYQEFSSDEWINKSRYVYSYSEENFLQSVVKQNWNSGQNLWNSENKTAFEYDAFGNITQKVELLWDEELNIWINIVRTIYEFEQDSLNILEERQSWNVENELWVGDWRNEFSYDNYGNKSEFTYSVFNKSLEEWNFVTRSSYTYDINNEITEIINYSWDFYNHIWNYKYKTSFTSYHNTITELYETWDGIRNDWVYQNKCIDYFPYPIGIPVNQALDNFSLYPNPPKDIIYFNNDSNIPLDIKIYNIEGKLVLDFTSHEDSFINIGDLNAGNYILVFTSQGAILSANKFVKH